MKRFRVLARHRNWVEGATITESIAIPDSEPISTRRFTATVRGWRNWKIWEGILTDQTANIVIDTVRALRDRIDAGDETVFFT